MEHVWSQTRCKKTTRFTPKLYRVYCEVVSISNVWSILEDVEPLEYVNIVECLEYWHLYATSV
jgi:hypothetical protein